MVCQIVDMSSTGHVKAVKAFLEANANFFAVDKLDKNTLYLAAEYDHVEVVRVRRVLELLRLLNPSAYV